MQKVRLAPKPVSLARSLLLSLAFLPGPVLALQSDNSSKDSSELRQETGREGRHVDYSVWQHEEAWPQGKVGTLAGAGAPESCQQSLASPSLALVRPGCQQPTL